jgi:F5/8 type C domain.
MSKKKKSCGTPEVNPAEVSRSYSSIAANDAIGTRHARSMLDSPQAWSAGSNAVGQWMMIDLGETKCVSGVVTQGRKDHKQWVTKYTVQTSLDQNIFSNVLGPFNGNINQGDVRNTVRFAEMNARYVKFIVQAWRVHISMRAGVMASCGSCSIVWSIKNRDATFSNMQGSKARNLREVSVDFSVCFFGIFGWGGNDISFFCILYLYFIVVSHFKANPNMSRLERKFSSLPRGERKRRIENRGFITRTCD